MMTTLIYELPGSRCHPTRVSVAEVVGYHLNVVVSCCC